MKNTWKGIQNLIDLKVSSNLNIKLLSHDNETITDPKLMADIFNDYFSTIALKTKAKIKFSYKSFIDYLNEPHPSSFFLTPCSPNEIQDLISSLNPNKSTGPNSIPTKILKLLKNDISNQLADMFNLSFSSGIFPTNLKIAQIVPIHKKESKLLCSNYRPISMLSNVDKILEKLMHNRIYDFITKNNLIYPLQFGFHQHHSTNHALLHLTETIMNALDSGSFACGIFVDLQKAFDTVDHDILLKN